MKNIHLSATLELVWTVSDVIPKFSKCGRWMGRMSTSERVLKSPRIVANKEDTVKEEIVEDFGKEKRGEQGQGGEKPEDQDYEPPHGKKSTILFLFWMLFITIDGVELLPDDVLGLQLTDKTSILYFKCSTFII